MTQVPGAWIETLACPTEYAPAQLELACAVAHHLHRGRFVLVDKPRA